MKNNDESEQNVAEIVTEEKLKDKEEGKGQKTGNKEKRESNRELQEIDAGKIDFGI
jgi:hypothetical protein